MPFNVILVSSVLFLSAQYQYVIFTLKLFPLQRHTKLLKKNCNWNVCPKDEMKLKSLSSSTYVVHLRTAMPLRYPRVSTVGRYCTINLSEIPNRISMKMEFLSGSAKVRREVKR